MQLTKVPSYVPFAQPDNVAGPAPGPVAFQNNGGLHGREIINDLCIVLADENSSERSGLAKLVEKSSLFGCQVHQAKDVETASELTKRFRPDVIILDSLLPNGHLRQDAVACMRMLARLHGETAFLILAGEEDQAAAIYSLQEGAYDYLLKDQVQRDPIHFHRSIKNAVQRKRLESEFQKTVEILRDRNRELELLNQQLWKLSHTDELTGYFNRRHIMSRLEEEVSRGVRYGLPLSIVLVDIDHFKRVNDTFGHLAGDRALQGIADLFRSRLRESDLIGRFGGEEFLLILPHTDLAGAEAFCHRLRDYVEKQPLQLGEQVIHITASFGLATLGPSAETVQKLLRISDRNLYRAKSRGRNRVVADLECEETIFVDPTKESHLLGTLID
jgi:diguanylate cyclase (GGDEF)-like protein